MEIQSAHRQSFGRINGQRLSKSNIRKAKSAANALMRHMDMDTLSVIHVYCGKKDIAFSSPYSSEAKKIIKMAIQNCIMQGLLKS